MKTADGRPHTIEVHVAVSGCIQFDAHPVWMRPKATTRIRVSWALPKKSQRVSVFIQGLRSRTAFDIASNAEGWASASFFDVLSALGVRLGAPEWLETKLAFEADGETSEPLPVFWDELKPPSTDVPELPMSIGFPIPTSGIGEPPAPVFGSSEVPVPTVGVPEGPPEMYGEEIDGTSPGIGSPGDCLPPVVTGELDTTTDEASLTIGDPIYAPNGEFVRSERDLYLLGPGFPLQFVRTYRAHRSGRTRMGNRWDLSGNVWLEEVQGGLVLHNGFGRRDLFEKDPVQPERYLPPQVITRCSRRRSIIRNASTSSAGLAAQRMRSIPPARSSSVPSLENVFDSAGRVAKQQYEGKTLRIDYPGPERVNTMNENGVQVECQMSGALLDAVTVRTAAGTVVTEAYEHQDAPAHFESTRIEYSRCDGVLLVHDRRSSDPRLRARLVEIIRSGRPGENLERKVKVEWDPAKSQVSRVLLPSGFAPGADVDRHSLRYAYDAQGQLLEVHQPLAASYGRDKNAIGDHQAIMRYTYGPSGRIEETTDANLQKKRFVYGTHGNAENTVHSFAGPRLSTSSRSALSIRPWRANRCQTDGVSESWSG